MTYKEKYEQLHPRAGKALRQHGAQPAGCPGMYFKGGMTSEGSECFQDCAACWNQEMEQSDEEVIREPGVVRMTSRQLSELWLAVTEKCAVDDIVDIHQPDKFTGEVSWQIYRHGNEKY